MCVQCRPQVMEDLLEVANGCVRKEAEVVILAEDRRRLRTDYIQHHGQAIMDEARAQYHATCLDWALAQDRASTMETWRKELAEEMRPAMEARIRDEIMTKLRSG